MILELMRSRRSVRRFRPDAPPRETLERLIEAAVTAPSASNKQPWRFLVVTGRGTIDRLAAAVREAVARVAAHVPGESQASFRAYGDYFTRFEAAPVVIAPIFRGAPLLTHLAGDGLGADDRAALERLERDSGLVGAALALENLLLAAHELGLGASAMTGPLVAARALEAILEVPTGWGIVALVPVGFPAEVPPPPGRKPVDRTTRWIP